MTQTTLQEIDSTEADKLVEAEHGPCVFISHPDGSRFGFKRIDRAVFTMRNARADRGGDEAIGAEEKMLQERCVFPSREEWNRYVANSVFEMNVYAAAYRVANGDIKVHDCLADEIPAEPDPTVAKWLTNGKIVVGFRKPGRAEVKMYQAKVVAQLNGEKQKDDPTETILKSCARGPEFAAWLEENLFGLNKFADAFLAAFGMTEARVSGK